MINKRVLIVEDDIWLADLYGQILTTNGCDIAISHSAIEAIDMVDEHNPDVVMLDVLLAGSTAFALLHELQSYGDTGGIPVILCTNLAESLSFKNIESYGIKRVLDKTTMQPNDIVAAVKGVV